MHAVDQSLSPPSNAHGVAYDALFSAAGVTPGDYAEWSLKGWPLVEGRIVTKVKIKGGHTKNGWHAIEVEDETGTTFRAYPSELRKSENH